MSTHFDAYVRAWTPQGKVTTCHVNDLTEESFRDFVMETMCLMGAVVGVKRDKERHYFTKLDYKEET